MALTKSGARIQNVPVGYAKIIQCRKSYGLLKDSVTVALYVSKEDRDNDVGSLVNNVGFEGEIFTSEENLRGQGYNFLKSHEFFAGWVDD